MIFLILSPKNTRFREGSEVMKSFLVYTLHIVQECSHRNSQGCESFHALKAQKSPKDRSWKTSRQLRMDIDELEFNYKGKIYHILKDEFGLDISDECIQHIKDIAK